MLESVYAQMGAGTLSLLLCTLASLLLGLGVASVYLYRTVSSKSFAVTLALLPVMVQSVIFLVNGSLGTGIAVMGPFSLVHFRSIPGSAREIGSIFFAMAIGLATGMGYLLYAVLFFTLVGAAMLLLSCCRFGEAGAGEQELKVTIPENLDYNGLFDDLFAEYAGRCELLKVRTTNMGSLFELCYRIRISDRKREKEFLDQLRCRNGNLPIVLGRLSPSQDVL